MHWKISLKAKHKMRGTQSIETRLSLNLLAVIVIDISLLFICYSSCTLYQHIKINFHVQKSLLPFIDGFFQCLTNWKPNEFSKTSSNSLFEPNAESLITDNLLNNCPEVMNSQMLVSRELYLLPIYYLFSMFDDIAASLNITDKMTLRLWKSNRSFF